MKTFIVTIREVIIHELVVNSEDTAAAEELGIQHFHNNVDVDYAVDQWIEGICAEEEFKEGGA